MRARCIASIALLAAACGDGLAARVDEIAHDVRPALYECADRAWLGTADDLSPLLIVLVSDQAGRAWVIDASSTRTIDPATLPPSLRPAGFGPGEIDGAPAMAVSLDSTGTNDARVRAAGGALWHDSATSLAVHETFHAYSGQQLWPRDGTGSRATPYPAQLEPRYLRAALELELELNADGTSHDLGPAAYLEQRYETEEPDEAARLRDTDRIEGSARSFEIAALALADLGCAASDAELDRDTLDHLPLLVRTDDYEPMTEPYDLGALAGILLRRGPAGWEADVEASDTMAGRLLRGETPRTVPDDAALRARVGAAIDRINLRRAEPLDQLIAHLSDPDYVRIALPTEWGVGSFNAQEFALLVEQPDQPEAILRFTAESIEPTSGAVIRAQDATVLRGTGASTPCASLAAAETIIVALIPQADLVGTGSPFQSVDAELSFAGLPGALAVQGGLPWLCPP